MKETKISFKVGNDARLVAISGEIKLALTTNVLAQKKEAPFISLLSAEVPFFKAPLSLEKITPCMA